MSQIVNRRRMEAKEMKTFSNPTVKNTLLVLIILALCVILLRSVLTFRLVQAQAPATLTFKDNEELARLHREDQADRNPGAIVDGNCRRHDAGCERARSGRVESGPQALGEPDSPHLRSRSLSSVLAAEG
jgi:hypothetical protein